MHDPMNRCRSLATALAAIFIAVSPSLVNADWPGLRGPGYDGAVRDARLFDGESGTLSVGWKRELGSGYSVVSVDGSRLIAAFQAGAEDMVAAFDLEHGDELWRQPIGAAYAGHTGSHDGPIATPVLHQGRVYGLGPRGDLFSVDAGTGEWVWRKNLVEAHQAEAPYYGFASSPVVVEDVLVVGLGAGEGKAFGGFDIHTGELHWAVGTDTIRYQSPILTTIAGEEQVLVVGNTTLSALDPATGQVLWTYEHGGDQRDMGGNTIVPIPAGEGRILLMNTHPTSVMLQVTKPSAYEVTELWSGGAIKSSYVQPVYHDGYLYGMNSKIFTCVNAATGKTVWRSREAGDGFPTVVGDHLVIMNKPGTLRVAEATPEGYREITSIELFDEHSWSAPAYANGHLYARSMSELARIDITSAAETVAEVESSWIATTGFGQFLTDVGSAENKAAAIDAYLEAQSSFPIIEDTGAVHFVYRGEAQDVGIVGDMIGFRREDPMIRVADTDLFYYSTVLEPDAAVGYGFIVDFEAPIADPLNPEPHDGPFGEVSWLTMPAWRAPGFLHEADAERRGTTEEIEWTSEVQEGRAWKASVYLPAGYDPNGERRYPVLYFLDGQDALEQGSIKNALDNLIGREVEPLIGVFVLLDEEGRGMQPVEQFMEMLTRELVPLIDGRFRTVADARARAVAGAEWAGDTALLSAFNRPEVFGRVGTLWPILFGPAVTEALPNATEHPLVIFQTWGAYHIRSPHEAWDQAAENRVFFEKLREAGYRPAGGEAPEGLGWNILRGHTDDMLTALFPMR
jgi:enterochelin esterase-like enzyme/outer membrane protein assembly factor BamB